MNGRVSGGGRGSESYMNERNVSRARRRARPSLRANGSAGKARDPALRATAARRLEGERRLAGARRSGAGVERAGAARCLSEAGRHCREAAATTTAAVTGTAPGVSTGDTGPCGTGSAGPMRWEGRVTSREGGPRRGRRLRPHPSSGPGHPTAADPWAAKRTTGRGWGLSAARTRNGFLSGRPAPDLVLRAWHLAAAPGLC